jgi:ferredoxin
MTTGVAICEDLASHGLDPEAVSASLEARGIPVEVVPGPCERAGLQWNGWDRTVFAVCPDGPSAEELRSRARRTGADPAVGVARVDLREVVGAGGSTHRADATAAAVLAASLAGLAAAPPSPPDAFRLSMPNGAVSRRSLLSTGGVRYVPVASVGLDGCRGTAGCGLCVEACPVDAIAGDGRVPQVDRDVCIGCGACVSACPVEGAVRLPGADLERFEAEVDTVVREGEGAGVLLSCANAPPVPGGRLVGTWLPVEVPCLSIVTPSWALAALAAGAPAVAFRGCGEACPAEAAGRAGPVVSFVREALALVGIEDVEDRVRLLVPEDDAMPASEAPEVLAPVGEPAAATGLREPAGSAGALAALGAAGGSVTGQGSPFGRVAFEPDGCTMCGLCAAVCPTGAIRFDRGSVVASLDLDRAACVGCGHCAAICPEGVLGVERAIDLEALGSEPAMLKRSTLARCRRCGEPVAPDAMLERLRPMLDPAVLATTEGLCQRCRVLG